MIEETRMLPLSFYVRKRITTPKDALRASAHPISIWQPGCCHQGYMDVFTLCLERQSGRKNQD